MLLDEPTTWLDISHQIDLLELLSDLNREKVSHARRRPARPESSLPIRHAFGALREGNIVAQGAPKRLLPQSLSKKKSMGCAVCMIIDDPVARDAAEL